MVCLKIRMSEKDKNSIFALLSILLILFVFVVMFFPGLIDYKYSVNKLTEKRDSIESMVVQLESNEGLINKLKKDIETKMSEAVEIEKSVVEMGSMVSVDNFNLHIPSLFVTLEDSAKKRALDLTIMYDQFDMEGSPVIEQAVSGIEDISQMLNGGLNAPQEAAEGDLQDGSENAGDPSADVNPEVVAKTDSAETQVPEELENLENTDNDEIQDEITENGSSETEEQAEDDYGIKNATIPIVLKGEFLNIRDFIRSLDELDFVEAAHIDIVSGGEDVTAGILLKIYYGEGDID